MIVAASGRLTWRLTASLRDKEGDEISLGETVMLPGLDLFGRVRTEAGEPMEGVLVTATDLTSHSRVDGAPRQQLTATSRTDKEGIFRLLGVPFSGLRLTFSRPGYITRVLAPVSKATPLEIRMEKAVACSGTLLDAAGSPRRGRIRLRMEDGNTLRCEPDADGSFTAWAVPGLRYRLESYDADGRLHRSSREPRTTWTCGSAAPVPTHPRNWRCAPLRKPRHRRSTRSA